MTSPNALENMLFSKIPSCKDNSTQTSESPLPANLLPEIGKGDHEYPYTCSFCSGRSKDSLTLIHHILVAHCNILDSTDNEGSKEASECEVVQACSSNSDNKECYAEGVIKGVNNGIKHQDNRKSMVTPTKQEGEMVQDEKHKVNKESCESHLSTETESVKATCVYNYSCTHCPARSTDNDTLKQHLWMMHGISTLGEENIEYVENMRTYGGESKSAVIVSGKADKEDTKGFLKDESNVIGKVISVCEGVNDQVDGDDEEASELSEDEHDGELQVLNCDVSLAFPYTCSFCPARSKDRPTLEQHIFMDHNNLISGDSENIKEAVISEHEEIDSPTDLSDTNAVETEEETKEIVDNFEDIEDIVTSEFERIEASFDISGTSVKEVPPQAELGEEQEQNENSTIYKESKLAIRIQCKDLEPIKCLLPTTISTTEEGTNENLSIKILSHGTNAKATLSFPYSCSFCPARSKDSATLEEHILTDHTNLLSGALENIGDTTTADFDSSCENIVEGDFENLNEVTSKCEKVGSQPDVSDTKQNIKEENEIIVEELLTNTTYSCHHCKRIFKNYIILKRHIIRTHLSELSSLKTEKVNIVQDEKPCRQCHQCTLCNYTTEHIDRLKRHIIIRHINAKTYKCTLCSYQSSHCYNLKRHMSTHINKINCPLCEYQTKHFSNLKLHMMSRHSKKSPFNCPYCSYNTTYIQSLNRHITMLHIKEKLLYKRLLFRYKTSNSAHLHTHIKDMHSNIKNKNSSIPVNLTRQESNNRTVDYSQLSLYDLIANKFKQNLSIGHMNKEQRDEFNLRRVLIKYYDLVANRDNINYLHHCTLSTYEIKQLNTHISKNK